MTTEKNEVTDNYKKEEAKFNEAQRVVSILNSPGLIDDLCAHVINGGSIIELANKLEIKFSQLSNWIHSDKEIEKRYITAINDRSEWVKEALLRELRRIATVDIRDLFNDEGSIKSPHLWSDELTAAISGVEVKEEFTFEGREKVPDGVTKKVKMWDKIKALELLGKNLAMFTDKVEHSGKVTLEDLVAGSIEKKDEGK